VYNFNDINDLDRSLQKKEFAKPLAFVIHNLVLYETIKPLLISSPVKYDLLIPKFADPMWQRMAEDTFSFLKDHDYNPIWLKAICNQKYIVTISANIYSNMPSSRYHIRIQYGLAKENWNFGIWNLNYDLIFCYGPYDSQYLRSFAPVVEIGPIKFANFKKAAYKKNSEKAQLLYLPTYGKGCSIEQLSTVLSSCRFRFNITTKLHHGTSFLEEERAKLATTFGRVVDHRYALNQLLSEADLVLSDGSGAIFDAIAADVPVAVFQPFPPDKYEGKMSLEQKVIVDGIIPTADNPSELEEVCLSVLKPDSIQRVRQLELKQSLFSVFGNESVKRAWDAILPFLSLHVNDGEYLSRCYLRRNFNALKQSNDAMGQSVSELKEQLKQKEDKIATMEQNALEFKQQIKQQEERIACMQAELQTIYSSRRYHFCQCNG
jgi:hypothetical protein